MPRPPTLSTQIVLRIPDDWLKRAESLRPHMADVGIAVTRTDVLRVALARGLEAIEVDVQAKKPARGGRA
jgi:hypothetical protein